MTKSLKLFSQQPNGVTYANPDKPDFNVRFKTTSQSKLLDGVRTTNYITEVIATDVNEVNLGSKTLNDAISVRIRLSGAVQSMDRVKEVVGNLATQLPTWAAEDVFIGFQPSTLPVDTE